MIRISKYH
jgi:aminoglycoside phosphotransferase (APT) family kinase protein